MSLSRALALNDSQVYKAKNKVTKDIVALKKIRVHSENFGVSLSQTMCKVAVNHTVLQVLSESCRQKRFGTFSRLQLPFVARTYRV